MMSFLKNLLTPKVNSYEVVGKSVIDVGAHIGTFILSLKQYLKNAIVIEPSMANFKLLKANIKLNQLEDKIILLNKACDKVSGNTVMIEENNLGSKWNKVSSRGIL